MQTYQNLRLVGTSHIAQESVETIRKLFSENPPTICAVELDQRRAIALFQKKQRGPRFGDIRKLGLQGYFFALLGGWAERKLGSAVGMKPGADMKEAMILSKKNNIKIAFIDQDIEKTLRKLSKSITWKERWHFVVDVFKAMFGRGTVAFDLRKVPKKNVIKKMIGEVKKRYPSIHRVLIQERNEIMAKNLAKLLLRSPDEEILAVVGAGHEEEIIALVKKYIDQGILYTSSYSFGK